ncbi:MAG TPA: hypothetical protein VGI35_09550 [Steroidobacteraceae bacterium]
MTGQRAERGREPAAKLWLYAALLSVAGCLAGCTTAHVSADTPAGVNLAGTWKLDPQRSTDTHKALDDLLKNARKAQRPHPPRTGIGGGADAALLAEPPMVFAPDVSEQRSLLANGDWLKIEQRPDEIVISNGQSTHSYVPGERSVVSVPGGVADQSSGWKGHEYLISLKPQVGPSSTQTFKLSPDGKQLLETIEIGKDGRIPSLKVTRVYVPTQEPPSSAVPSED